MSLGVCYNGKRKVIVVSPTTKLQSVLEQACEFFNLDANCCKLKKGKAVVDLTIPFRFSSLPPNSSVDIEVSSAPAPSGRAASTRLGFSVEGGSIASFSDTFPSTFTLAQVLDQLVEHGKLPPSATSAGADPVVIYLQSGFRGSQLAETTLANLGLSGQAARLNLRYAGAAVSTAAAAATTTIAAAAAADVAPPSVLLLSPPVLTLGTGAGEAIAMDTDARGQSSPSKIDVSGGGYSPTAAVGSSSPRRLVEPQPLPPQHPADLLQSLLREHFDAVSKPAVVTIAKYIFNIWGAPLEPKFRVLYFDNKAFVDKIAPCAGAVRFLTGIGFAAVDINGRRALQLALSRAEEEAEAAVLEPAVRALERALEELAVSFEERPVAPDRALLARRRAAALAPAAVGGSGATAVPAFDPYKTYVRRVAEVNPDGSMKVSSTLTSGSGGSITESRLSALAIRRRELEGEPGDASTMDEPTELLVPNSLADTAAAKTHGNIDDAREFASGLGGLLADDDDGRMPGDGRLLAASLKDKIQNPSEDAPLTTAALRALKKAQKELVYNRSLVRVRLPDRGVLQRRFHPRHTMRDVYAWVSSCSTEGSAFELYVTPPRQVLAADDTTLHDLQFVPAAIVNLSWRGSSSPMSLSSSSSSSSSAAAAASGLLPDVLRGARSVSQLSIPTGAQLVAESAAGGAGSKGASGSSSSSSSSSGGGGISLSEFSRGMAAAAEGKDSGAGKKRPSWFKL